LTHGPVRCEGCIPLYIQLCFELRGFGPVNLGLGGIYVGFRLRQAGVGNVQLCIRLVNNRLEGTRIDSKRRSPVLTRDPSR